LPTHQISDDPADHAGQNRHCPFLLVGRRGGGQQRPATKPSDDTNQSNGAAENDQIFE